jgi:low temperature requirement protein LtrA
MLAGVPPRTRLLPPRPRPSTAGPLSTDEDQSATYVELFFDLVFVYAVTQLVELIAHDLTWAGVGRAAIAFWLVWWAWTQYTWALNSADTNHPWIELGTLAATATAFFLAVTIGDAYGSSGEWFAAMYLVVRGIGLALYVAVAREDHLKRRAVNRFAALSLLGFAAVVAGAAAEGDARTALWCLAIALDLFAGILAGGGDGWDIRPDHFGERHALFVIITLGESLIVAASGLAAAERTPSLVTVGGLAVALSCALWWCYFARVRPRLVALVERRTGGRRSSLARNVYSFLHFPVGFGVILVAVAVEHAVEHPTEPLRDADLGVLVGGVALFLGAMGVAMAVAEGRVRWARPVAIAVVAVAALVLRDARVGWVLGAVVATIVGLAIVEQRQLPRAGHEADDTPDDIPGDIPGEIPAG